MNKIAKKYILLAIVFAVIPVSVSAATVLRTGDTVTVANDQVVSGDFYATGGTVSNSGLIEGDLYTAAGSFTNNGTVDGDLTVVSGSAQIHASVTDDVRVVGGDVVIAGNVGGDVVVVGGLLKVLSTAEIQGDVLFFGGELQVLGKVEGSVMGTAEQARIDSHIGQSIDMKVGAITLGDRAEVLGDVRYTAVNEVVRSQNAVVVGDIVKNSATDNEAPVSYERYVISFIVILFSALVLQLIFRAHLQKALPALTTNIGMSGLIGIAGVILIPLLMVVSLASMLGILVGLILLFGLVLLLLVSFALSSILVGAMVNRYVTGHATLNVVYTILGAALLQIALLIPAIGPVLVMVIFFIVFGALLRSIFLAVRA